MLSRKNCGVVQIEVSSESFKCTGENSVRVVTIANDGLVRKCMIYNNFTIFGEEATSALAVFHASSLFWSNWNLEINGFFFMIGRQISVKRNQMPSGKPLKKPLTERISCKLPEFCLLIT